jgi:tetratricopeptide (TPR) repeat protein
VDESQRNWEQRIAEVWATGGDRSDAEALAAITALAAERSQDDAAARYEQASALDFAGREAEAEALYRKACARGLDEQRRPRAVIQLASNLGRARESVDILRDEIAAGARDGLADVRIAFLARALVDVGRSEEAVSEAPTALARHLPEYDRAVAHYATELLMQSR